MYPINQFEEEMMSYQQSENNFSTPKKGFSNVTIVMDVFPDKICYKIRFMRNDRLYTVSYWDQVPRFKVI